MTKHWVHWKTIGAKDVRGSDYQSVFPAAIAGSYRGRLLSSIVAMERKKPILFEQAAQMAQEKFLEAFNAGRIGNQASQCLWYGQNFVEWISSLGYHIELTGDEFESYLISDKLN